MQCARKRRAALRSAALVAMLGVAPTAQADVDVSVPPVPLAAPAPPSTPAAPAPDPGALPALPLPLEPLVAAARGCRGAGARPGSASSATLRGAALCLVNRARAHAGRPAFGVDRRLGRSARRHSADMARRNYFGHVSPAGGTPGRRARAVGWRGGIAEVIAWGCGSLATPRAIVHAWLRSPPHAAILLGPGRKAGFATARGGGCAGRAFWTGVVG
jgi:uncharacterized protein YkwD